MSVSVFDKIEMAVDQWITVLNQISTATIYFIDTCIKLTCYYYYYELLPSLHSSFMDLFPKSLRKLNHELLV